jgi:chromatin remodeling complex protein RSC6
MNAEYLSTLSAQFASVNDTILDLKNKMALLQSQLKMIEKTSKREEVALKKKYKTQLKETGSGSSVVARKPSGFAMPSKVSSELCEFLNKTEGTEIARTEVTKSIVAYIKGNCLHADLEKKNIITPDGKLKLLLGISDEDKLTYFNLQRYMNKHFLKPDIATATAMAAAVEQS